jgi:hypothetical protein
MLLMLLAAMTSRTRTDLESGDTRVCIMYPTLTAQPRAGIDLHQSRGQRQVRQPPCDG